MPDGTGRGCNNGQDQAWQIEPQATRSECEAMCIVALLTDGYPDRKWPSSHSRPKATKVRAR